MTATKRATDVQDTPLSVSVVGGEALQSGGVQRLSDITDALPNVRLPDALNPGNAAIRGISSQSRATARVEQPVGAYLDEVFVGSKFLNSFLFDINRIEIIRGPQGTLWGRNTAAGAISYLTNRPSRSFEAYGEAAYGNYDLAILRAAVSGPLADGVDYRLALGHLARDGYERRVSGGTFGNQNIDGARGSLRVTPSDRFDVTVIGGYSNTEAFPRSQVYFSGPFAIPGGGARLADTNDRSFVEGSAKRYNLTAIANYDLGDHRITSVTGYNELRSYYRYDEDGTRNDFVVSFFGNPDTPETSKQFSQELRLASPSGEALEYTLGLYLFRLNDFNLTTFSYSDFLAPALTEDPDVFIFEQDSRSKQKTTAYAAFGQASYHATDKLTATVGFRLNHEKKRFAVDTAGTRAYGATGGLLFGAPQGAYQALEPFKDTVLTVMGGLNYQFSDDVMAYATYSEGYKSGGFNTDAAVNPAISASFGPEGTKQFEVGLRSSLLDRRLIFNLTAFWMDYDRLQVEEFLGLNVQVGNAGKARSRGIEAELAARPAANWTVSASAGYLDAKFLRFRLVQPDGTVVYDRDGNRLPFAPEFSSAVNVRRDVPVGPGRLFVSGEWIYSAAYFTEPDNSAAGRQSAYHTLNARLGFEPDDKSWQIALWGRNLTDRDIRVDFNDALPGFFGGSKFEVLAPPRTYGIEATYRF